MKMFILIIAGIIPQQGADPTMDLRTSFVETYDLEHCRTFGRQIVENNKQLKPYVSHFFSMCVEVNDMPTFTYPPEKPGHNDS